MSPFLAIAIYLILWWLAFFVTLPFGIKSLDEAKEEAAPGVDRGSPAKHGLVRKALWAAGIAAVLWLFVAWAISVDLFGMRR